MGLRRQPERVFIVMGLAHDAATWSFFLAAMVWWTVDLGLRPLSLILLGTVLELTVFLAEVPTGVVADRFSRKWSVVLSFFVMSVAMALSVATLDYRVMLVSQALFGIGWTFRSGAEVAWLSDEMAWLQPPGRHSSRESFDESKLLLRRHRLGMTAGLFALVPTILFGTGHLRQVIFVGAAVLGITALWLSLAMTDHYRRDNRAKRAALAASDTDEPDHTMRAILTEGFGTARRVPSLRLLVMVMFLFGLGAEALDRLGFKQFLDDGDFGEASLLWTGLLFLLLGSLGVGAVWFTERALARGVQLVTLATVLLAIASSGAVIAAIAPAVGIAVGLALQDPCREALDPVSVAWANQHSPESSRATVLSLVNQTHSVGVMVGGVCLGALAEAAGIRWTILAAGGLWAVATLLSARGPRHDPQGPPTIEDHRDPSTSPAAPGSLR